MNLIGRYDKSTDSNSSSQRWIDSVISARARILPGQCRPPSPKVVCAADILARKIERLRVGEYRLIEAPRSQRMNR